MAHTDIIIGCCELYTIKEEYRCTRELITVTLLQIHVYFYKRGETFCFGNNVSFGVFGRDEVYFYIMPREKGVLKKDLSEYFSCLSCKSELRHSTTKLLILLENIILDHVKCLLVFGYVNLCIKITVSDILMKDQEHAKK